MGPSSPAPLPGAQSMAQARTHRDQGSLSSLVYSFFPGPASCQAPLPTVGLPSPCTVSSLPALLPAASPASQPLCPLHFWKPPSTSPKLSASLHSSHLALLQTSQITCTSNLVSTPDFHCLAIFPHSFIPPLLYHLSVPLHTLFPVPPPASSPLSILSSPKDPLLWFFCCH